VDSTDTYYPMQHCC